MEIAKPMPSPSRCHVAPVSRVVSIGQVKREKATM